MRLCVPDISLFFFFQAEDGIRDLVRSRGLGDVYKRQGLKALHALGAFAAQPADFDSNAALAVTQSDTRLLSLLIARNLVPVSYTHLTLPTSDLV